MSFHSGNFFVSLKSLQLLLLGILDLLDWSFNSFIIFLLTISFFCFLEFSSMFYPNLFAMLSSFSFKKFISRVLSCSLSFSFFLFKNGFMFLFSGFLRYLMSLRILTWHVLLPVLSLFPLTSCFWCLGWYHAGDFPQMSGLPGLSIHIWEGGSREPVGSSQFWLLVGN